MPDLFQKIVFGEISAEQERKKCPQVIVDGFLDFDNIIDKLLHNHEYLVLGNKGSGKTMVANKIDLICGADSTISSSLYLMGDFPFKSFTSLLGNVESAEKKYGISWLWMLLLMTIRAVDADKGKKVIGMPGDSTYESSVEVLRKFGLLPTLHLRELALKTKETVQLGIPNLFQLLLASDKVPVTLDLQFMYLNEYLKNILKSIESANCHYVIIDGIDDGFSNSDAQRKSIFSLIKQAGELNEFLFETKVKAKIIVMCRSDIFDMLSDPNKNKIRNGYSIKLDWYHNPRNYRENMLYKMIEKRSAVAIGEGKCIFKEYFPEKVDEVDIWEYFLEHTRHLPRDLVVLFNELKNVKRESKVFGGNEIKAGLTQYSKNYYKPEVADNLAGIVDSGLLDRLYKSFEAMGKRSFKAETLLGHIRENFPGTDEGNVMHALGCLYDIGAIGCKTMIRGRPRIAFKFRNDSSSFNRRATILLHRGLFKSFNLI